MSLPTISTLTTQWSELSDWYEANCLSMTSKIFRTAVSFLSLPTAATIIETACGPGNGVEILRELTPSHTKILASDLCPAFIEKLGRKNVRNVEGIVANAEELPYGDEVGDRYVANLGLMLVPRPEVMLQEAFRVLKPNGLIAVTVWGSKAGCTLYQPAFEALSASNFSLPPPTQRSNFHLSDPETLKTLFRTAGFPYPIVVTENSFLPFVEVEEYVEFFASAPDMGGRVEREGGREVMERFRGELREVLERVVRREGKVPVFEAYVVVARKPAR